MKVGKETYCDICHLVIAPYDPRRLDYGRTQYHGECQSRRYYRMAQAAAAHFIVLVLVFLAVPMYAAMPKEGDPPTPGCRVKNGLMEPAIVYGIKQYVDEDGKAATDYWVKLPNQPWLHKNGRAVNIPQSEFLPYGEVRMVKGPQGSQTISCERPNSGNSGISAEH